MPPSPSAAATPSTFTSKIYGYSVVLPAGWSSTAATERWDGDSIIHSDAPNVDQFFGTGLTGSWATAAAYAGTLKSDVAKTITDTAKYHGTTCTAPPESQEPITVGGDPGTLLAYNCGVLINIAVTVHDGVGYSFGFRDAAVQAAAEPTDHAIFVAMLESLEFPETP